MPENLLELPNEILQIILSFLKAYELELGASQACKQLNEAAYTLPYYRASRFFKIADYSHRLKYYSASEVCTYLTLPENKYNLLLQKAVYKYFSSSFIPSKEEVENLIKHGLSGNADLARTVFWFFTATSFIDYLAVEQATLLCIREGNTGNLNASKKKYKTATGVDLNEEIKKIPKANDLIVAARIHAASNRSNITDFFTTISHDAVLLQHLTPRDAALLCIKEGNTGNLNASKSTYKAQRGVDLNQEIEKIPDMHSLIIAARMQCLMEEKRNNPAIDLKAKAEILFNSIINDESLAYYLIVEHAIWFCAKVENQADLDSIKLKYKEKTGIDIDQYILEKNPIINTAESLIAAEPATKKLRVLQ